MMSAATVHTVLGVVGNVIALVRYLSPVPTFYHIWKNAVAALVLSLAHTHGSRAMIVGLIMVVFGTGMYASPLTVMEMVIQTKSVEYMPLFLSITLLLINSICWTAYALVLRFDLYLSIANGLGVIFSVAQLILYAVYYKSTLRIIEARNAGPSSATATAAVSH
nr:unnamed protein product [Digitaria exilis]